ncbi:MAG: hypothetical protein ACSLFF_05220 [Solirubrobacterales bacterium]
MTSVSRSPVDSGPGQIGDLDRAKRTRINAVGMPTHSGSDPDNKRGAEGLAETRHTIYAILAEERTSEEAGPDSDRQKFRCPPPATASGGDSSLLS